jgi:predicted metal-dependent hydrolase
VTLSRPEQDALWLDRLQRDGPPDADHRQLAIALRPSLELLRSGRYWEAHESIEDLWRKAPYPMRLFYYALIKVAVGLLHIQRRNPSPAGRQLAQAATYLEPFTPAFAALDTEAVLAQVQATLNGLTGVVGAMPDGESLPSFDFPDIGTR